MKVFIVGSIPFPFGLAATNRVRCYAEGLINSKLDCEVIITNATERQDKHVFNKVVNGIYRNIPFRYLSKSSVRNSSFWGRRIQDFVSMLRFYKFIVCDVHKSDVVFMYGNKHELFVLVTSKLFKFQVYRELCEYPYATENDSLRNRIKRNLNLRLLFPLYNGFVVISEALKNVAIKYSSVNSRIIKVPILINIDNTTNCSYVHTRPYIFHSGTMYERKDGIVSTMKAFAMASKQLGNSVDYILAGPRSPHQRDLDKIITDNKLENNVLFLGNLKKEEVEQYQNGASLAILNKNDNLQNRCGFSTKLGELLLSATPVVTTTVGEANLWLVDGESAYITDPHKPELIASQIVRAFSDEKKRMSIGLKGKQIAEQNFDCNIQGSRLAKFFKGDESENLRYFV